MAEIIKNGLRVCLYKSVVDMFVCVHMDKRLVLCIHHLHKNDSLYLFSWYYNVFDPLPSMQVCRKRFLKYRSSCRSDI